MDKLFIVKKYCMSNRFFLIVLLSLVIFSQTQLTFGQCNPVLVYNSDNSLCEGTNLQLTVSHNLAPHCLLNDLTNVYEFTLVNGSTTSVIQSNNSNILTNSSALPGIYRASVKIKDDGTGLCSCVGLSLTSNAVVVYPKPDTPIISDVTITCGSNLELKPQNKPIDNYVWYNNDGTILGESEGFLLQNVSTNTAMTVRQKKGNCLSDAKSVTIKTAGLPIPFISNADNAIFVGNSDTLMITNMDRKYDAFWYSDPAGTKIVSVGPLFITPPLFKSTDYYAQFSKGNCSGNMSNIVLNVKSIEKPKETNYTTCPGNAVDMNANFGSDGGIPIWYDSRGVMLHTGTLFTVSPVSSTTYYLKISNFNSLSAPAQQVVNVVDSLNQFTLNYKPIDGVCIDSAATINVVGESKNTWFQWYYSEVESQYFHKGYSYKTPPMNGDSLCYWVEQRSNYCKSDRKKICITVKQRFSMNINLPSEIEKCERDNLYLPNSISQGKLYFWQIPDGSILTTNYLKLDNLNRKNKGIYKYKEFYLESKCYSQVKEFELIVNEIPQITIYPQKLEMGQGEQNQINVYGGYSYIWRNSNLLSDLNISNPKVSAIQDTNLWLKVTVKSQNGCVNIDSLEVVVTRKNNLNIYNFITPNNDGDNDYWHIGYIENLTNYEIFVADINQNIVFHTRNYENNPNSKNCWIGRDEKENDLATGMYYYLIHVNGKPEYRGNIYLNRLK